jgi:hypothetical protein
MEQLLFLVIVATGIWAVLRLAQVHSAAVELQRVKYRIIEQDRPVKG